MLDFRPFQTILGLFRRFYRRCASILAQHYKGVGVGGGEGWIGWGLWVGLGVGVGVGKEEENHPGEDTR